MNKFIKSSMTEEQLQKWIEERKKRFPTKAKREKCLFEEKKKTDEIEKKKIDESKPKKNEEESDSPIEIKGKLEDDVGKEIKEIKILKEKEEESKNEKNKKRNQDITQLMMDQMQKQVQEVEYDILLEAIDFLIPIFQ
ncbi:hypothetical protein EDI_290620 [Entamoeba dispar SAW760]|uniref:FMR1-interacting protein 1 conserved domain-containing protein n=1 Tax=Entamoeba dispar (strain ATCC PRA-260 / SAW760) TaxID=370354 RepID=B0EIH9_ENTDS|nr:uncharacterized protein EDI_290620 [Entamoeba dispar SAW760]EDR25671.1 hypothetical protein EDI_290620 [Entamoeba dispar SAW760]|eukprot:EDR25671.1 hypothetical protein EDI_290620 [Entamoeba dispar SAW760]